MPGLDELKQKYASVLDLIQKRNVRLAHLHVQNDKLFMQGGAPNDAVKNQIWDQIKRVDPSYSDLICDLSIDTSLPAPADEAPPPPPPAAPQGTTYTVKPGDSLWKISQTVYGAGHLYKKIIEGNPGKLKNENSIIHPGDVLNIPPKD